MATPRTPSQYLRDEQLVFRLQELVADAIKAAGSKYRLEARITDHLSREGVPGKVTYEFLEGLATGNESTGLRLSHLIALHSWFSQHGHGLDEIPLLRRQGLLGCLRSQEQVRILIAAKMIVPRQTHYTRWDARALDEVKDLLQPPGTPNPRGRANEFDVLLGPPSERRRYEDEPWHRLIEEDRLSLVSIGSPRSSLASELMLARMFRVAPSGRDRLPLFHPSLPFQFVWPPDPPPRPDLPPSLAVPSTFALGPEDLGPRRADLADRIRTRGFGALACRLHPPATSPAGPPSAAVEQVFEVPAIGPHSWNSYGVICAQRRPAGHLWVVLAGLSGPATLAAARMLQDFLPAPPLPVRRQPIPPVHWALVEARLREGHDSPEEGDNRQLLDARLISLQTHLHEPLGEPPAPR